ncbi:hypothetical protein TNCT_350681 [Trichonephila clavata]|uniref:Uncharacterized protein n=1 Tax=Trichonephila clavata TaxID=2740835 RepID=A0A8X6G6S7_TRICU|nr:hypothetical protein TNCT_350681 [Trichonephila clavata]
MGYRQTGHFVKGPITFLMQGTNQFRLKLRWLFEKALGLKSEKKVIPGLNRLILKGPIEMKLEIVSELVGNSIPCRAPVIEKCF